MFHESLEIGSCYEVEVNRHLQKAGRGGSDQKPEFSQKTVQQTIVYDSPLAHRCVDHLDSHIQAKEDGGRKPFM